MSKPEFKQLAYYCRSLGQHTGIYLVFCPNNIRYPETAKEDVETIKGMEIRTYMVEYGRSGSEPDVGRSCPFADITSP